MQKNFSRQPQFSPDGENYFDLIHGIKLLINRSCQLDKSFNWLMWYPEEEWDHEIKMDLMLNSPSMEIKLMEKMRNNLYTLITSINNLVKKNGTLKKRVQEIINQAVAIMEEDKIDRMEQMFYRSQLAQYGKLEAKEKFWIEWNNFIQIIKPFFEDIQYKGNDPKIIKLFKETNEIIHKLTERLEKNYH